MSVNAAAQGGVFRGTGGHDGGRGDFGYGYGRGRGSSIERPICQMCVKIGHNAGRY
jgi:hypothetical protein